MTLEQYAYAAEIVGVIADSEGVLLAADDVGNIIWRVAPDTRAN